MDPTTIYILVLLLGLIAGCKLGASVTNFRHKVALRVMFQLGILKLDSGKFNSLSFEDFQKALKESANGTDTKKD